MINLLLGAPGGGKSYEAVVYHVLTALKRGRKVVTNLPLNLVEFEAIEPGCSALIEVLEKTKAVNPGAVPSSDDGGGGGDLMGLIRQARASKFRDRPFSNVEDFMDPWRSTDGTGPLYVVDECHFSMPRGDTSRAVEEWFSMHRHYNADVLLITQSAGKISVAIKDLVQVCYKVRKAVAFGDSSSYIRKVLDGVNGGEISSGERKYLPQYFKLYKSHTQGVDVGEQKADDVTPFIVKFTRFKWFFLAVTGVAIVYAFWPSGDKPKTAAARPGAVVASKPSAVASSALAAACAPLESASAAHAASSVAVDRDPEPFKGKLIHITGWMNMGGHVVYTFAVSSQGQRIFDLKDKDLRVAGYEWQPLGECSGRIVWRGKPTAVSCDAPALAMGSQNLPVVIADGSPSRSNDVRAHREDVPPFLQAIPLGR